MTWTRLPFAVALPLTLLAALAAGCGNAATDPRAGSGTSDGAAGHCSAGEEGRPAPTPCVTQDWNARVAENHSYREPLPLTDDQKAEASPRAETLAGALAKLADADSGTTEDAVRTAAAKAIGVGPEQIELRGDDFTPLRSLLVGGGKGRVCVNGTVHVTGQAEAEVIGRTVEGTCLPGLGGH